MKGDLISTTKHISVCSHKTIIHKTVRLEKARKYAKDILKGDVFPPVKGYRKCFGEKWVITDGAHRVMACRILNKKVKINTKSKVYFGE